MHHPNALRVPVLAAAAILLVSLAGGCSSSSDTSSESTTTSAAAGTATSVVSTTTTAAPTSTTVAPRPTIGDDDPSLPGELAGLTIGADESLVLAAGTGISFDGALPGGTVGLYRLQGDADTLMTLSVIPTEGEVTFTAYDPDDVVLLEGDGRSTYSSLMLADGRYLIVVRSGGADATYEISVAVE